jgi:hypothetical protein
MVQAFPPWHFQYDEDITKHFDNIVFDHCLCYSDGGENYNGCVQSVISELYIVNKENAYVLYIYRGENWFGGDNDTGFYFKGSTNLNNITFHTESTKYIKRYVKDKELSIILSGLKDIEYNIDHEPRVIGW